MRTCFYKNFKAANYRNTMKQLSRLLLLLLLTVPSYAFSQNLAQRKADIDALKISIITTKAELTPDEGKAFWPVYNEYEAEKNSIKRERRQKAQEARANIDNLSDKDIDDLLQNDFMLRQRELDIDKKYFEKFKKVLPLKKVAKVYAAEDQFKRELLKRLRDQGD
ncbi:hypothetical protein SAMN06265350_10569 [Solitalea koreensis]|uniref:LTXXQ motif family protein n=2 Tax=Solitalea koreensis TaxID=543615 RepID=A0A521CZW4_9SPHI|nr:hypothetical protein SAMN06265350_10569 [Solitalea koreensis]